MAKTFEQQLTQFLVETFGEDWDDSADKTAERWIRAMKEFSPKADMDFKVTAFPSKVNQLITVCGIEFSSICKHHLFPFVGRAYIGYVPNKLQIGLSKIPRIVHHFATRPQTQETLTEQIASFIKSELEAMGVAVVIESTHTCMSSRGVRETNGVMRTSEMRGVFLTSGEARSEFLTLIGRP
jgi:GTP cyclohydrolase I